MLRLRQAAGSHSAPPNGTDWRLCLRPFGAAQGCGSMASTSPSQWKPWMDV